MATHSPNGEFQLASYSQSVTSSIIGPMEEMFGSALLRITLPTEVVIVSKYVRPVASSHTTQLEVMLESPGVITSPIDRVSTGASWPPSGTFKQAITPPKPHGGVEGPTSADVLTGGVGSGRVGALGRQIGDLAGIIHGSRQDLPLGLEVQVGWWVSLAAITGWDRWSTLSQPTNFGILSLGCSSGTGGVFRMLVGEEVVELFSPSTSGMATPWKTSSSVKVRYHSTSSLSSNTLFTNKWGSPPVGRSFCSTQYWRALVYATTFSQGISLMSWLAKMELTSSINLCWQRHGRAGGAWKVASPASSSCSCSGSPKDTLTCLASFLVLSSPGMVDSSIHQLGVLHLSTFHGTYSAKSKTAGSSGIFLPSLSDVSGDPCRKEATVDFNCGSSPKSASLPSNPSLPDSISGLADWLGPGLSAKLTWQHLFLCLSVDLWRSQLLDLIPDCGWALIWLSLSISPSKAIVADSTFWCTSRTMARLLSTELSLLWQGLLLLDRWESPGLVWAQASRASSLLCG